MNKRFPIYVRPEKNELFSSWLMRISAEIKIKTFTFSKFYFPSQPIWNRDVDRMFPKKIVDSLLLYSNLKLCEIFNMFLISYKEIVFNDYRIHGYTPGILNLGINHRKRNGYGTLCCPGCLSKDIIYYRKEWRLFFSLVCVDCKCKLIDRCPNCKSPISFHRLEVGSSNLLKTPLFLCWNCKLNLSIVKVKVRKNSPEYKYQTYINDTILKGYNDVTNYSFSYFYVLQLLSGLLTTSSLQWNRVKKIVEKYYSVSFSSQVDIRNNMEERRKSLLYSFKILNNWPTNFHKIFTKSNVRISDFNKDTIIPFWFEKELRN
ncbi:hypothetical protein HER15_08025 [Tenacibaculum mesophilum]|uniref:TniQ domain-containing protein n=1 Tax=Tenacibaculum mesophilum TaxID=104268 RepID=A0AAE9MPV2_9FLAO|nr:TniQ family protein [Tenacibaculum mesophilum]UTD15415.1 hypothetical protein HER15_08025 [Tenacibaculum mesophilum]